MPKDTNAKSSNDATILNDVSLALLNLNADFSKTIEEFKSIKEVLDTMLQRELVHNQNLTQIELQQAMIALYGTDNVQGAKSLDEITLRILDRQNKIAKLRTQVAIITGEGGTKLQQESLNKQLSTLSNQNILAQSIVIELLKGTLINGQTKGIDTNTLIKASKVVELQLNELQELNQNFKTTNSQQPPRPRSRL